ncbi:MAG: DUF2894 domain-containing protein [Parahaliea sp.]
MRAEAVALALPDPVPAALLELGIEDALERLYSIGAHQLDPARFAYLRALGRRGAAASGELAQWYGRRLQPALADYAERAASRRAECVALAEVLAGAEPQRVEDINTALARWDLRALSRLRARAKGSIPTGPLARVVADLEALHQDTEPARDGSGLDSDLHHQQLELLSEFGGATSRDELRSARAYRQRMQRTGAEELLALSLANTPEDAGPLNPQRLSAHALSTLQCLSPACCARYITYINALLYLEGIGD